jgi:hypothetical protein
MMLIYLFDLRPTGAEAGGRIWWNSLRPVHSLLYALFAYLAILGMQDKAWIVLITDTLLGLAAFYVHHYRQVNFLL